MTEAEELELLELEDAEAKAKGAPIKAPEPSRGAAALAGVQQLGTFGWGDELGAALQGGLMKVTGRGEFGDTYRRARDENRAESKAAKDAHPGAYYAAGLPAALATAAVTTPLQVGNAGLLTRALAGGVNGAVQGGFAGLGDSEAETAGGMAKDAGTGALLGGGVGAALPVAGAALGAAARPIIKPITGRLSKALEAKAIDQGRRVLTNGADSLSTRAPVRDDAVAEAIRSGGIRPFGNTKSTLGRLENLTEEQAGRYSNLVTQLEQKGMAGPEAETLAQRLLDQAAELEKNTMNDALPEAYLQAAQQATTKAESTGRLGLRQSLNLTRSLQKQAKYGRVEDTPLNDVRRDIASTFRSGIEEAVDQQAPALGEDVRALAGQFVPVKQRLGRLIEAESAATRGAARGAQRNAVGMKDIAAAVGSAAAGHPGLAPVAAAGSNFLNNRVPSAVASYGLSAADALRGLGGTSGAGASGAASERLRALLQALRQERPIFIDGGSISTGPGGALASKRDP